MFCEEAGLDGDEFGGALRGRVAPRAVEDPERPERSAQGLVVAVSTRSAGRWPSRRRAQHRRPRSTRIRSARQCAGRHPLSFWHVRSAADMMAGCVRGRKSRTPRWRSRDCSCFVRAALCVWPVAGRSPVPAFGAIEASPKEQPARTGLGGRRHSSRSAFKLVRLWSSLYLCGCEVPSTSKSASRTSHTVRHLWAPICEAKPA